MTENTLNPYSQQTTKINSKNVLNFAAIFCLCSALLGQIIFAAYIAAFYFPATLSGKLERWNEVLREGYIPGDIFGNIFLGSHLLLAAIVTFGAIIQLTPYLRNSFRALHKWNGRIYIVSAAYISLGGCFLLLTRGAAGGPPEFAALFLNTALILIFGFLAWENARKRDFKKHKQWTLRLYIVVSGVWFFRVGLMLWLLIHQAPVGFDPVTFTGPLLSVLIFACFLVPLALLELYFHTIKKQNFILNMVTSISLIIFAVMMLGGIFGATMGLWLPRII